MKLADITLRLVRLPLIRPYVLSYRTYTEFEPIIVEVRRPRRPREGYISPSSAPGEGAYRAGQPNYIWLHDTAPGLTLPAISRLNSTS